MKRPQYIAIGLVVLMMLVMFNLPNRTAARLKLGIGSLFAPLFGLTSSTQRVAEKAGDAVLPRSELLHELEALRQENQELRLQSGRAEATTRENERLRQLVSWPAQKRARFRLASVVLREPSNWWRTVQIDLGSRNGLSNNLPVLSPEGALVGRVSSVGLTRSQVLLLGDPNCKVAARVDDPMHDTGVIGAAGPMETEFVELGYLSRNAELKPGQNVWTSGNGGIFPKDILIGKVVDSRSTDYGLTSVARVKLAANLSGLEEVWVMMEP